jgi:hypothetical protein
MTDTAGTSPPTPGAISMIPRHTGEARPIRHVASNHSDRGGPYPCGPWAVGRARGPAGAAGLEPLGREFYL